MATNKKHAIRMSFFVDRGLKVYHFRGQNRPTF